jgi:hypothetical protein
MDTKETVLTKIANGQPISWQPKSKAKIGEKVFHYRLKNFAANGSDKFPFNINPNTLTADFEVWICGSENTFFTVPIEIIKEIYNDPDTYTNSNENQGNIKTLTVDSYHNIVKYGRNGKQISLKNFRNKTITDLTVPPVVLPTQEQVRVIKYGPGGEGKEHLEFKNFIANNPSSIGIENVEKIENDNHIFPSSDRPDIIFTCSDNKYFIVEIEIENCVPGTYQAIKYKSLFCAEKGLSLNAENVTTMLVARKINSDVKKFCEKYGVKTVEREK